MVRALRVAFNADDDLRDKWILYTPRYNAFFRQDSQDYDNKPLNTDGEGLDMIASLVADGGTIADLDFVHFMMYDINAQEAFNNATQTYFVEAHYQSVITSSLAAGVPPEKLIMGFEPGAQAYTGVWAEMENDKSTINFLRSCTGGTMYWAANDRGQLPGASETTGDNCATLSSYAAGLSETPIGNTCGLFSGRRLRRVEEHATSRRGRKLTTYGPCSGCLQGSSGNMCKHPTTFVCWNNVNDVPGSCWEGTFSTQKNFISIIFIHNVLVWIVSFL